MAKGAGAQSTTRRTLHYYWWATRRHLGLYIGMIVSTISFGVLLSYGNPLVMSLIVDRISAEPVAADQVFTATNCKGYYFSI